METGTKECSIRLGLPSQRQLVPEAAPNLENATERRPGSRASPLRLGGPRRGPSTGPQGPLGLAFDCDSSPGPADRDSRQGRGGYLPFPFNVRTTRTLRVRARAGHQLPS